jgi:hypothetical protein
MFTADCSLQAKQDWGIVNLVDNFLLYMRIIFNIVEFICKKAEFFIKKYIF